ncbi:transcriptional regulator with XRE-family HTH domain [Peptoniphilus olsenii]|uniref:Transcriptional regulator with XRE-family HTH domain n=1 Tax=Peptoniphilus olsenii TaxID=411570 RepID=A0ABV2J9R2_9FIRM
MDTLGKRILKLLNEKNLTQRELAKIVGTTEVSIGRYINDKREPNATMLSEIANALNVSSDYLLGRSNIHKPLENKTSKTKELEQDFPEGISVLYRANRKLTPEQKEMMLRMIKATFFEDEENEK